MVSNCIGLFVADLFNKVTGKLLILLVGVLGEEGKPMYCETSHTRSQ